MRGPLVYCFEGADNGPLLQELRIPQDARFTLQEIKEKPLEGMKQISFAGIRVHSGDTALYSEQRPVPETVQMKAIPYFAWGNRGENQMKVWILEI